MSKKENSALYMIEGIACILVVFIHFPIPGNIGRLLVSVARIAVPIFFMVSGYYLAVSDCNEACIKRRIHKLLKSTVNWSAIYIIAGWLLSGLNFIEWIKKCFSLGNAVKLAVLNEPSFGSSLWFVYALLYCYIAIYFVNKSNKQHKRRLEQIIPLLVLIAYVLQIMGQKCNIEVLTKVSLFRNWLFLGLPFFSLGMVFFRFKKTIKNIPNYVNVLFLAGGGILLLIEVFLLHLNLEVYFGTIILVSGLFSIAVKYESVKLPSVFGYIGKNLSANIYYLHVLIGQILIRLFGHQQSYWFGILVVLITIFVSTVFYVVQLLLIRISQKFSVRRY